MGFFRISGANNYIAGALLIFGLLALYALGSSIYFLVKEIFRKNDELVRKIAFDSMAMSFGIILLLHIVQMIIRVVHLIKPVRISIW